MFYMQLISERDELVATLHEQTLLTERLIAELRSVREANSGAYSPVQSANSSAGMQGEFVYVCVRVFGKRQRVVMDAHLYEYICTYPCINVIRVLACISQWLLHMYVHSRLRVLQAHGTCVCVVYVCMHVWFCRHTRRNIIASKGDPRAARSVYVRTYMHAYVLDTMSAKRTKEHQEIWHPAGGAMIYIYIYIHTYIHTYAYTHRNIMVAKGTS
jgi:hypothetical protein